MQPSLGLRLGEWSLRVHGPVLGTLVEMSPLHAPGFQPPQIPASVRTGELATNAHNLLLNRPAIRSMDFNYPGCLAAGHTEGAPPEARPVPVLLLHAWKLQDKRTLTTPSFFILHADFKKWQMHLYPPPAPFCWRVLGLTATLGARFLKLISCLRAWVG